MVKRNLTESELKHELETLKKELDMQENKKVLEELFDEFGDNLTDFQKKHFSQLKRLTYVRNRIRDIKSELMTPEERERHLAYHKTLSDRWQSEAEVRLGPETKDE